MANGKLTLGKQSGGTLGLVFPDGVSNTEVVLPESGELVTKNYVDTQNDQNVKTSGNQTIAGVKTFSSSPIVPTPTTGTQAVNKDYVDNGPGANFVANDTRVKTAINASGTAPIYACRAWVNFNGTGTVAIRASGNVSSVADNGVGDYTVNFITAIPDVNYAASIGFTDGNGRFGHEYERTANSIRCVFRLNTGAIGGVDTSNGSVSIFK